MSEVEFSPWTYRLTLCLVAPILLPIAMVVVQPIAILAAIVVTYGRLYPERHGHIYDLPDATRRQQELVKHWRSKYRKLDLGQRIRRAWIKWRRSRRIDQHRESAVWRSFQARRFRKMPN